MLSCTNLFCLSSKLDEHLKYMFASNLQINLRLIAESNHHLPNALCCVLLALLCYFLRARGVGLSTSDKLIHMRLILMPETAVLSRIIIVTGVLCLPR